MLRPLVQPYKLVPVAGLIGMAQALLADSICWPDWWTPRIGRVRNNKPRELGKSLARANENSY